MSLREAIDEINDDVRRFPKIELNEKEIVHLEDDDASIIATPETPIIGTSGLIDSKGILMYDSEKNYAVLNHCTAKQYLSDNLAFIDGLSLEPRELYKLKVLIFTGVLFSEYALNNILSSLQRIDKKNIQLQSVEIRKAFIKDYHLKGNRSQLDIMYSDGNIFFDSRTEELVTYPQKIKKFVNYTDSSAIKLK